MDKIIVILFIFLSTLSNAQILTGKVVDESNQPLPFVNIRVSGTHNGTQTDFSGDYSLHLNGNSEVIFYCVGFDESKISTNGGVFNLTMKTKYVEIKEVEVSAKKVRTSENILLLDKKESTGVENSIGTNEMTKKGISNVEDGLKKITGITFNGGRINTRGLDDRYNQITLNGVPLPSNNLDRKNIDLNLLPIGLVDNVKVRKTYSSDQWSNLGGAQIDINSTEITDKKFISFRGTYNRYTSEPSGGINFMYSKLKNRFGVLFNINISRDNQNINGNLNLVNKQGDYFLKYDYKETQSTTTPTGIFIMSFNKNNLEIQNSFLYINQNNQIYRETFGKHFDYQKDIFTTRIIPTKNELMLNQLRGRYVKNKWEIETNLTLSKIRSGENNRQQFVYLYDGEYQFNNIDKLDNHIFSNENRDDRVGFTTISSYKGNKIQHKFGYSFLTLKNLFDYNQMYFDLGLVNNTYPNIDPNNPYNYITPNNHSEYRVNDPASRVDGNTIIHGIFYTNQIKINKFDISSGVRVENVYQSVNYRDQLIPILKKSEILENNEILPFLSIRRNINDKNQIKFISSITSVRPRFREMVPFIYTEVFAGTKIQGNPKLINSKIYSFDLSYEIYPKNGELLGLSIYSKTIQNPIEKVNVATASGRLETFQNSNQASVFGGEFEFRKQINKLKFDYNLSILFSSIEVSNNTESSVVVTNSKRQLQGSSPLISNLDIFFDINKNNSLGVVYNYTGKKLNSVGIFGLGDVYQLEQHTLNLIYNIKKNKYNLSFRINNLFNAPFVLEQKTDKGDMTIQKFKVGQDLSFMLRYVW